MNWAMPCAPTGERAPSSKRDSFQIRRAKKSGAMPTADAFSAMRSQMRPTRGSAFARPPGRGKSEDDRDESESEASDHSAAAGRPKRRSI